MSHSLPQTAAMTLSDFLLARIADDEWRAREALACDSTVYNTPVLRDRHFTVADSSHIPRWKPARVLAECEAKRLIVNHLLSALEGEARALRMLERLGPDSREAGEEEFAAVRTRQAVECIVQHLAEVHADHPDYRQEWRP